MVQGMAEHVLDSPLFEELKGKVQLIFTSPPYPLRTKKRYGNRTGQEYLEWFASLSPRLVALLSSTGSVVVELGNAWDKGKPVMSVLGLEALLAFMRGGKLNLCQQFICDNPARLPGPAQWVNVERIRVKDSFTHVWWMSPSLRPKANNRNVLRDYSRAMARLLERQSYNSGKRPSEHNVSSGSFLIDHQGAIPSNVLSFANTNSADPYQKFCREKDIKPHPARMPAGLAEFFIKFLTDENDLVLDPFGGSNTTGAVAEQFKRRWMSFEPLDDYIRGSVGRFGTVHWEQVP